MVLLLKPCEEDADLTDPGPGDFTAFEGVEQSGIWGAGREL